MINDINMGGLIIRKLKTKETKSPLPLLPLPPSQPALPPPAPALLVLTVDNPFKYRNKISFQNYWFRYFLLIGLCLFSIIFAYSTCFGYSSQPVVSKNSIDTASYTAIVANAGTGNQLVKEQKKRRQQNNNKNKLHLRPAYLTDDGTEDEGDDYDNDDSDNNSDNNNDDDDNVNDKDFDSEIGEDVEEVARLLDGEELKTRQKKGTNKGKRQQHQRQNELLRRNRRHRIPRNLIFTHHTNLLLLLSSSEINKHVDNKEELALAVNVQHSIEVHNRSESSSSLSLPSPSSSSGLDPIKNVFFFTDTDCIESLRRIRPGLVPYFMNETEGMYKADICRGSALYEHGGFYLDVDVGVRHDLWMDLSYETEFVTAKVHQQSNWLHHFFQAIVGSSPKSPIMERYLELFEEHYDGTNRVKKGPLGVILLKRAWDQIQNEYNDDAIEQQQKLNLDHYDKNHRNDNSDIQQNKKQRNRSVVSEFYQEILYNDKMFSELKPPAPTWGKRRACHFLVVGIANKPSNAEIYLHDKGDVNTNVKIKKSETKKVGLQIPVLSRIPGSRMCAEEGKVETGRDDLDRIDMNSFKWWEQI